MKNYIVLSECIELDGGDFMQLIAVDNSLLDDEKKMGEIAMALNCECRCEGVEFEVLKQGSHPLYLKDHRYTVVNAIFMWG